MTGTLDGKVALITGAGRGQGRSHALRLAEEGADIIAIDICKPIDSVPYPMASSEDLDQTIRLVEKLGRRIVARQADVRDFEALTAAVQAGVTELGHLDIVCANAGIVIQKADITGRDIPAERWRDVIDINLTGVWHTLKAALPPMIDQGTGGAIVITSSTAGLKGMPHIADYSATKHGVVGLMKTFAQELAPHRIRVNTVHPTGVRTPMVENSMTRSFMAQISDRSDKIGLENLLPVDMVEPVDVSNAVLWLVSEAGRYVTGASIPIDAGFTTR
ncbi:mycofactocin-coupled SDR family oxidoreductase [Rhodococcus jostii]|uniref:SDR family mycofactocin-dependent oxidoreductase n=1 Tax=Rhodococcus jostii TaxID=132919 RepID=A0A1H4JKW7_RHOJO|nr:mycofactocin-coupled SDR family oxidoreductase [Rhodococcus jostii]SEB46787.1 SDR family mycofactocin-dependent oxidoreductase [Rhodococcus jostii]